MTIEGFLKRSVDGYLIHDLESMAKISLPNGQDDGAVGYPMVTTTLAGIELLGSLISKKAFDSYKGSEYFLDYWNNCLVIADEKYRGLGKLFRQLVRNGLAHSFIAKPRILVIKTDATNPIYVGNT